MGLTNERAKCVQLRSLIEVTCFEMPFLKLEDKIVTE